MERASNPVTAEQIIAAVDKLSLRELEQVFDHVLAVQAERKAPHLAAVESSLLSRINEGRPPELEARLSLLRNKREEGTIAGSEYDELTALTDQAEELHASRMAAMVELATLRGVALSALMDQLGIHFPENV